MSSVIRVPAFDGTTLIEPSEQHDPFVDGRHAARLRIELLLELPAELAASTRAGLLAAVLRVKGSTLRVQGGRADA